MLMVTDKAKQHLRRLLMANTSDPDVGIRLKMGKGMQFGVLLDRKMDNDYIVEHEGSKVLLVGSEYFPLVHGAVLDTDTDGSAATMVITKSKRRTIKKPRDNIDAVR